MKQALVLTVIGADKPGLVERLSRVVSSCDANWEQSRMARLGGRFAGMLLVTVPRDRAAELESALAALQSEGLHIRLEPADHEPGHADWRSLHIELTGQDHPGIVAAVSRTLAGRGVNVEELHSSVDSAPMAGHSLFKMTARIAMPPALEVEELRADLESLAGDLMVDITLADSN